MTSYAMLTILNGGTDSAGIGYQKARHARTVGITAPSSMPETITVQVSPDKGTTWATLLSGGADVQLQAGKALVVTDFPFTDLRIHASSNVSGDRVFQITVDEVTGPE